MIEAIDCQGLGGGLTLGMVQAGVTLVRKVEQSGSEGFLHVVDSNRHLVGDDWDGVAAQPAEWKPKRVPLVFGNPPCSGFSMMSVRAGSKTRRDFRGIGASSNSCMWDLIAYAARCKPDVVVMESVVAAGSDTGKAAGRELMRALRAEMEELTGRKYYLTHCFHNGLRLGGSSERRRYFFVLSRKPFSVGVPQLDRMPTLNEVLGDLPHSGKGSNETLLRYTRKASWWARSRVNPDGYVDGNATWDDLFETSRGHRLQQVIDTGEWAPGEQLPEVLRRIVERDGSWPAGWDAAAQQKHLQRPLAKGADWDRVAAGKMSAEDYCAKWGTVDFPPSKPEPWQGGAYAAKRWDGDKHGLVMAGDALQQIVHPTQPRTLTYREAARIMGFPDAWSVTPYYLKPDGSSARASAQVFGKGCLVDSGRWIGEAAVARINGEPLEDSGVEVGEREFVVDHRNLHRDLYAKTYRSR